MFKIEMDHAKKVLKVIASGMLTADELSDFLVKFPENVKKIDPTKYALVVDAREQKTLAPDAVPLLEKALRLYTETPFSKRISVVLESAVAMQQIKRVGKDDVDQFILVTSLEDAYKNI